MVATTEIGAYESLFPGLVFLMTASEIIDILHLISPSSVYSVFSTAFSA
jgi:hypothetical protein